MQKKIGVIGTGNWGTTVALMVAINLIEKKLIHSFAEQVLLWGVEEFFEGELLSTIINRDHCNKKYLKGIRLPHNLVCTSDKSKFEDIDIVIVALPHQYIKTMEGFKGILREDCVYLSVIKGFIDNPDGSMTLISSYLRDLFRGRVNVLMGANIANEVAQGTITEGTLGYEDEESKDILYTLLNSFKYRITCVKDIPGVELLGSLKNVVSLGCGLVTGLGYSDNTKAALFRNGIVEMNRFLKFFYPESKQDTIFQSCGVADLFVSCSVGRNFKFGIQKGESGMTQEEFEESIGGQKIQGTGTAEAIYKFLVYKGREKDFPLFCTVYGIFLEDAKPEDILNCISSDSLN